MISRATLMSSIGGDTIQVVETASHLRKLGHMVDIGLANDTFEYEKYDLIHFFNIIRPADILVHIRKSKLPYVVSTIFVDYSEAIKYESGIMKMMCSVLGSDNLEYLKALGRTIVNNEKINSLEYFLQGHYRSIRKVIANASMLLPNSASEYQRVSKKYNIDQRFRVVPNAINIEKFKYHPDIIKEGVLCVGRIEPRKNQLALITAMKKLPYNLTIVGSHSPNHKRYYDECLRKADGKVRFIDHINQDELLGYYSQSKVHVLPSWFETTGLSSLEAAACGCNLVITSKGDTKEYFGDYAYYCDPGDISSIRKAVECAYDNNFDVSFIDLIKDRYTWAETAKVTQAAYSEVLKT